MVVRTAHLAAPPENGPALEALLSHVRDTSLRHEPGVAWYSFGRSADAPDSYVVIEVYRDAGAHAAHMEAGWVKESIPGSLRLTGGATRIEQCISPGAAPAVRRLKES